MVSTSLPRINRFVLDLMVTPLARRGLYLTEGSLERGFFVAGLLPVVALVSARATDSCGGLIIESTPSVLGGVDG